jgi:hypothetical protein
MHRLWPTDAIPGEAAQLDSGQLKSLTLRATTVMPCTRAVAAMSAPITGRGCA